MQDQGSYTRVYWLHSLAPLHVGTGRGVGYIDLPIQREKISNWPIVPGTAIKGVVADRHDASSKEKRENNPWLRMAFGIAGDENANAGSLVFSDARPVCLPVRSLYGTFAWCTSPLVLKRLSRDLQTARLIQECVEPKVSDDGQLLVPNRATKLCADGNDRTVYLEDLDLEAEEDATSTGFWAERLASWLFPGNSSPWRGEFEARFGVVSDTVFDFLSEYATEVAAHIRIDSETKTVAPGGLWYEESLPAETVMAGLVWCDRIYGTHQEKRSREELLRKFCSGEDILQIGGKATVGKGQVRCLFTAGTSDETPPSGQAATPQEPKAGSALKGDEHAGNA